MSKLHVSRTSLPWLAGHELYTPEEWADAMAQAEKELGIPPPSDRGSLAARIRQRCGFKLATRARQILWLKRALGSEYGKE